MNSNQEYLDNKKIGFDDVVTCSNNTLKVLSDAKIASKSDVNVLLTGESGTGKELIAQAIHNNGPKSSKPFIVVNCSGIPDTLLESELFGHEKGAFTDASSKVKGKFELADGGTIFLDEIGDMSLAAQAKTLRVVEEKRFTPLGGEKPISVNCRIITATNKNLSRQIKEGKFRADLFYRLNEMHLKLPPLRERKADIPLLIEYFIKRFNKQFEKNVKGASKVSLSYLMMHSWPGNIRELRSVIKSGVALVKRDTIWLEDLPFKIELRDKETSYSSTGQEGDFSLESAEREHILKILNYANWNKSKTAKLLKISRPTLDKKIKTYNIKSKA